MKFDKSKVYTALNANELKIGSRCIFANNLDSLKCKVQRTILNECDIMKVKDILEDYHERRFQVATGSYPLAYLVSEPEEKKLKWTDLKLGDVIRQKEGTISYLITGIDTNPSEDKHIFTDGVWCLDSELEKDWEKVE